MNKSLTTLMKVGLVALAITSCASYAQNLQLTPPNPKSYIKVRDVTCPSKIKRVEHSKLIGSTYEAPYKFNPTEVQASCVYLVDDQMLTISSGQFLASAKDVKKLKGDNRTWKLNLRNTQYTCGITNLSELTDNTPAAPAECSTVSESSTPATTSEASSLLVPNNSFPVTVNVRNTMRDPLTMQEYAKPAIHCFKNKEPVACNAVEGPQHLLGDPVETIYLDNDKVDQIVATNNIYDADDPRQTRCKMPVSAIKTTTDPHINIYFANRSCTLTAGPLAKN